MLRVLPEFHHRGRTAVLDYAAILVLVLPLTLRGGRILFFFFLFGGLFFFPLCFPF